MTDHATLTALLERLEAVRPHLWANPAAPVVDEAIATLRSLAAGGEGRNLSDDALLTLWRSVSGPHAQLTGPLIRFAGLVAGQGHAATPAAVAITCTICRDEYPTTGLQTGPVWAVWGPGWRVCKRCCEAGRDAKRRQAAPLAALDREALVKHYSGDNSIAFWDAVNRTQSMEVYKQACRLQEAENTVLALLSSLRPAPAPEETGR